MNEAPHQVEVHRVHDNSGTHSLDGLPFFIDEDGLLAKSSHLGNCLDSFMEGVYSMIPFRRLIGLDRQYQMTKELNNQPSKLLKVSGQITMASIYLYLASNVYTIYQFATK